MRASHEHREIEQREPKEWSLPRARVGGRHGREWCLRRWPRDAWDENVRDIVVLAVPPPDERRCRRVSERRKCGGVIFLWVVPLLGALQPVPVATVSLPHS